LRVGSVPDVEGVALQAALLSAVVRNTQLLFYNIVSFIICKNSFWVRNTYRRFWWWWLFHQQIPHLRHRIVLKKELYLAHSSVADTDLSQLDQWIRKSDIQIQNLTQKFKYMVSGLKKYKKSFL
jgi:hypothetical protein